MLDVGDGTVHRRFAHGRRQLQIITEVEIWRAVLIRLCHAEPTSCGSVVEVLFAAPDISSQKAARSLLIDYSLLSNPTKALTLHSVTTISLGQNEMHSQLAVYMLVCLYCKRMVFSIILILSIPGTTSLISNSNTQRFSSAAPIRVALQRTSILI